MTDSQVRGPVWPDGAKVGPVEMSMVDVILGILETEQGGCGGIYFRRRP